MAFHPPRFDHPLDLGTVLSALPKGASVKGLYFAALTRAVRAAGHPLPLPEISERRYVPFLNYPYADYTRLLFESAPLVAPRTPVGEGLRRLGQAAYSAFLDTNAGRVVFGAFSDQFDLVMSVAPRGWEIGLTFGKVRSERIGPAHYRLHFEDMPAMLETHQVGVVEGAMKLCGVRGEVLVDILAIDRAILDVQWG
jgi:uncharacterized protein (TIGR02265 family)